MCIYAICTQNAPRHISVLYMWQHTHLYTFNTNIKYKYAYIEWVAWLQQYVDFRYCYYITMNKIVFLVASSWKLDQSQCNWNTNSQIKVLKLEVKSGLCFSLNASIGRSCLSPRLRSGILGFKRMMTTALNSRPAHKNSHLLTQSLPMCPCSERCAGPPAHTCGGQALRMPVLPAGLPGEGLPGAPHPPPHRREALQVHKVWARLCRAWHPQPALARQRSGNMWLDPNK